MVEPHRRKLEVFIGAAKVGLDDARRKLIDAVLEAGHIPSGMELWSAGHQPVLEEIETHLRRCDVHIILLAARYGSYVENQKISHTEWEYEQSRGKRPILAFLLDDAGFIQARKQEIHRDTTEEDKENDLIRFRRHLQSERFCRQFKVGNAGIAELGKLCTNALHDLLGSGNLPHTAGWIRASSEDAVRLAQIRENRFLQRALDRLREFRTVGARVVLDRVAKELMAMVFWNKMMGPITRGRYWNLFFESGSTLLYLSHYFEDRVLQDFNLREWHITTNNVLVMLQLLLYTDVDVARVPHAAPDPRDRYGAIFPKEWRGIEEPPPMTPRPLFNREVEAVNDMRRRICSGEGRTFILATTSGLDILNPEEHFRGPHVGSHSNMLFKRALLTTGCPAVLFLNAEKLGDPFEVENCYPIFGPDLPWAEALRNLPLAICVGYEGGEKKSPTGRRLSPEVLRERNDRERVKAILEDLGFTISYGGHHSDGNGVIIAGNAKFQACLLDEEQRAQK